jgi:hypothetical protein
MGGRIEATASDRFEAPLAGSRRNSAIAATRGAQVDRLWPRLAQTESSLAATELSSARVGQFHLPPAKHPTDRAYRVRRRRAAGLASTHSRTHPPPISTARVTATRQTRVVEVEDDLSAVALELRPRLGKEQLRTDLHPNLQPVDLPNREPVAGDEALRVAG